MSFISSNSPPNENFKNSPLPPLFLPPFDFEKFKFPPDFVEFENPVLPSPPFTKGGGGAMKLEASVRKCKCSSK